MKQLYSQTQQANSNRHDSFRGSAATPQTLGRARRSARVPSIFPIRNKSKGPPGLTSPPPASGLVWAAASAGSENSNSSFKKNNSNHNQLINIKSLSIMKKQILILVVIVLAAFANVNESYGQTAVAGSLPKPLTCTTGPLNPVAGQPYDYTATFNPDGGTAFWYATKSTDIVTGSARTANVEAIGAGVVAAGTNYATNQTPTSGPSTATITWSSAGLSTVTTAAPLLVVVEYEAAAANCANNLKVFNIVPKNAFTVDIRSMASDGTGPADYGVKTSQCADDVEAATFNTTTASMNMDYGDQTLYFEVIAANFTGSFIPSYQLTGLLPGQTAEIFWGYTAATATNSLGAIVNTTVVNGTAASTALTNTKDGVSIYVKVVVQNNKVENIGGQTITLAVDAKNAEGQDDVLETDCSVNTAFADAASQDITTRPSITPGATGAFAPEN